MNGNNLTGHLLFYCLFILFSFFSCGRKEVAAVPEVKVEGVSVSPSSLSLTEGDIASLTVTVLPENAYNKTVLWSSSREDIATVSDGTVVAVAPGSATIRVKTEDGGKTAMCAVTVSAKVVPVTEISLNKKDLEMKVDETVTLTATVKPDDATDKTVTWSTSDASVATVSNGVVTAKEVGSATITAKAGEKSATCTITVVATPVTSVSLNKTSASLKVGETVTLTPTVKPDDATDKTVTWTTSDASVATVSNGVVTAKKVGNATITAKAGDKTATCLITVEATPVTSVTLNRTSASLKAGETLTLTATVKPDNATDKTVTWSSSDASVATVSNGVVTAKKVGSATITAKAGDKTATCAVTVVATPVASVILNKTTASLKAGETVTLTATVKPDDATDKTVTWSTSDNSVAVVSGGVVTAKGLGTAVITAAAGGKSASCAITVIPTPVLSVSLNKSSVKLLVGEYEQLYVLILPSDATEKTVVWSTLDETVAIVDKAGKIKAIGKGETVIVAQSTDGGKQARCQVVVTNVQSGGIEDTTDEEINI